jgi:hypothetical protein
MRIRIAAIGVSHWHSLYDSAYLRHAAGMSEVELVGLQDANPEIAARWPRRSATPGFTDRGCYRHPAGLRHRARRIMTWRDRPPPARQRYPFSWRPSAPPPEVSVRQAAATMLVCLGQPFARRGGPTAFTRAPRPASHFYPAEPADPRYSPGTPRGCSIRRGGGCPEPRPHALDLFPGATAGDRDNDGGRGARWDYVGTRSPAASWGR